MTTSDTTAEESAATYRAEDYPRPSVTVDVVILTVIDADLRVLLVKRGRWPFAGHWAIPGGFINMDESLEAAAQRELKEETNLSGIYLEQLYTFGNPGRDPRTRVITVVYYALIDSALIASSPVRAADDAAEAAWYSLYDLPSLAFDHDQILDYTLQRLRGKLEYTTIGFQLLSDEFTLSELQAVYEVIQHRRLDKRNFRRKILSTNILQDTGRTKMEGSHRPARLYRFDPAARQV